MSRIAYVPLDLAEPKEIVDAVRARRGGVLRNLDRLLLHSPELARGWNTYLGIVRTRLQLSPRLRELAICAIAVLNEAEYEYFHHAPEFLKAGGTQAQLDALCDIDGAIADATQFSGQERAVLALTFEMTRNVKVGDATFENARSQVGDLKQFTELVATIATYNMVSRFIVAMGVEH
jgi:alkylhydroperoxidase family enzyme